MAQYIFGILILVLLFRGVLGYKELEKGIFIAAGIVIAIAGGVVEACFDVYDLNIWLQRFLLVLPLLIPMLIFKGRKGIIFGISFCAVDIIYEITSAIFGIELITIGPDFESIDNYIISGIICIIALLLVRCYLQSKNITLYTKINAINVLLFVLASGMIPMFILKMNNDISFVTIVRYHIPYDICRFLIESIGIVLAIPVSVFIASVIMKIPSRKRGVRE